MINLKNRTEFSFKFAFGRLKDVIAANKGDCLAITDRGGTWGHVPFQKACQKAGKKPIFGVELCMVKDIDLRDKQSPNYVTFLAKNEDGLKEIYELVTTATEHFYYEPRLGYETFTSMSDNIIAFTGENPVWEKVPEKRKNIYAQLSPLTSQTAVTKAQAKRLPFVAVGDNYFPTTDDRAAYQIVSDKKHRTNNTTPQHIINAYEWVRYHVNQSALDNTYKIAEMCNVTLPKSVMVKPVRPKTLKAMCADGAKIKGINLKLKVYKERLDKELDVIKSKEFEDYFYVVADLVSYAKKHMLVGPARGSSCGSLICHLLNITDIDPIKYNLIFERFIDKNRADYPDIDIDFPDNKREMVFDYARDVYGSENVAKLGTVTRFKGKSTLAHVAKELNIPSWELDTLRDCIIERKGGDARLHDCLEDTFAESEAAQKVLLKYPELLICTEIEGHANTTGKHAAAMIVTENPVHWYCSVDEHTGTAQIDKYDAEALDLLKIDALGLRTLQVLQDVLDQIGWTREELFQQPVNQKDAIAIIDEGHFAGIFQFEGHSLKSLCNQMPVTEFEDMVTITALARPGPLSSGGANEFVLRRSGKKQIEYFHPLMEEITKVTYGVVVYQEQVMQIGRSIGLMNWADVSALRRAMGKSLGKEAFDKYWIQFRDGAASQDIDEETAQAIWDMIRGMSLWAFNRSHAVAYGMISYWCCVLKAQFPLEFSTACLRNSKDTVQEISILRELVAEGYEYKPYDKDHSLANWSNNNGVLIGGLLGIKGVGHKIAQGILDKRESGKTMTPRQIELLETGETPYDTLFETTDLWGHIIASPAHYNINSNLSTTEEVTSDSHGEFLIIGKLTAKTPRDLNEANMVSRRGHTISGQTQYIDLTLQDDTGTLSCSVGRYDYERLLSYTDEANVGEWFIIKGFNKRGFRRLSVKRMRKLTDNEDFKCT